MAKTWLSSPPFFISLLIWSINLSFMSSFTQARTIPPLPERVIVGYANWNQCDETIIRAVEDGVNVVIWFSINLAVDGDTGRPTITNGPDMGCVAERVREMRDKGFTDVVHLISIGGWNSPHPDTSNPVEEVFAEWERWNNEFVARPDLGFYGFDGFDWDIEGNDTPSSQYNHFTVECLDLMGRMSQIAKSKGYVVAMAPAESYLDYTRPSFDRSLLHEYPEWQGIIPTFAYHGLNSYAYLLARYGRTDDADTFDFITVQLYEGYSHAEYRCSIEKALPSQVLIDFVTAMQTGYSIDFSSDSDLHYPHTVSIQVPKTKLVIGLANGWAGDGKFLLIYPEEVEVAYKALSSLDRAPRGFAFWNILDEGRASPQRPNEPVWLAKGLNRFLDTHNQFPK